MLLVSWNLRQGGAGQAGQILGRLAAWDADTVVLSEVRRSSIPLILDPLRAAYPYRVAPEVAGATNGVFLLSRHPIGDPERACPAREPWRWVEWHDPRLGITFLGVHVPGSKPPSTVMQDFWSHVLEWAGSHPERAVILGDLNSGLRRVDETGATFSCHWQMMALGELPGWRDAWRHAHGDASEYTWYSYVDNGFRIDHMFATDDVVERITRCEYDHAVRSARVSDHSALLVEVI